MIRSCSDWRGRQVGRKKGIDTLISALAILHTQFSDFKVEIAGSGPLEEELKQQVNQLALTDKVVFLGPLPHDQVVKFVTGLDLFVLPCKKDKQGDMDGIPVVLMEAMMVGTAVISSKISGIPELVINEQTGMLIEPDNSEQLAAAMLELIKDEASRTTLIRNAEKKFSKSLHRISTPGACRHYLLKQSVVFRCKNRDGFSDDDICLFLPYGQ
ncbi:glycosyltransferase [Methylophaga thalassica]|uniref:glycosyltransferase n=1 Tax=Methylophaga thalassica TaxID=40223 RepID=UPI003608AD2A